MTTGTPSPRARNMLCMTVAIVVTVLVVVGMLHHRRRRRCRRVMSLPRQRGICVEATSQPSMDPHNPMWPAPVPVYAIVKRVRFGWEHVRYDGRTDDSGHSTRHHYRRQDVAAPVTKGDAAWNLHDPAYHARFRSTHKVLKPSETLI
jgi:hypothetical protein